MYRRLSTSIALRKSIIGWIFIRQNVHYSIHGHRGAYIGNLLKNQGVNIFISPKASRGNYALLYLDSQKAARLESKFKCQVVAEHDLF